MLEAAGGPRPMFPGPGGCLFEALTGGQEGAQADDSNTSVIMKHERRNRGEVSRLRVGVVTGVTVGPDARRRSLACVLRRRKA